MISATVAAIAPITEMCFLASLFNYCLQLLLALLMGICIVIDALLNGNFDAVIIKCKTKFSKLKFFVADVYSPERSVNLIQKEGSKVRIVY